MGDEERALLAPGDFDGGQKVLSHGIRNPVFLYEQTQLGEDRLWADLADFLSFSGDIPNTIFRDSHGPNRTEAMIKVVESRKIDICEPLYDDFRKEIMPYAWQMSRWISEYFIPLGKIRVTESIFSILRDYVNDPCGRLIHLGNGTYVLNKTLTYQ